ncbi:hypothetical protein C5167_041854 [Papaver somniferum]|nr:hypothetical protein C5167_041854 [Papaver somniferum]
MGNFGFMERKVTKYAGAATMYFVSKKLKKKHNITDERAALYEAANTWVEALKGHDFLDSYRGCYLKPMRPCCVWGSETHQIPDIGERYGGAHTDCQSVGWMPSKHSYVDLLKSLWPHLLQCVYVSINYRLSVVVKSAWGRDDSKVLIPATVILRFMFTPAEMRTKLKSYVEEECVKLGPIELVKMKYCVAASSWKRELLREFTNSEDA